MGAWERGRESLLDLYDAVFKRPAKGSALVRDAASVGDGADGFEDPFDPAVVDRQGFESQVGKTCPGIFMLNCVDHKVWFKGEDHFIIHVEIASNHRLSHSFRWIVTVSGYAGYAVTEPQFEQHFGDTGSQGDDTHGRMGLGRHGGGRRIGAGDLENSCKQNECRFQESGTWKVGRGNQVNPIFVFWVFDFGSEKSEV
jgi:hypothetical protein